MNLLETAKRLYRLKLNQTLPKYKRFLYQDIVSSKAQITGLYGSGIVIT